MRKDMFKVIVERPRRGGGGKRAKGWRRVADDDVPAKGGMRPKGSRSKRLNENLAPLERFFERRVGQFWPKVFAEVCENLDVANVVQKHVRDHVGDIVALKTIKRGDEIYVRARFGRVRALREQNWVRFYVHPVNKVLTRNPNWRKGRPDHALQAKAATAKAAAHYRRLDPLAALHKLDGVWYELRLTPPPSAADRQRLMPVLIYLHDTRAVAATPRADIEAQAPGYAIRKRQLSSRELAAAELANDPIDERPIRPRASSR